MKALLASAAMLIASTAFVSTVSAAPYDNPPGSRFQDREFNERVLGIPYPSHSYGSYGYRARYYGSRHYRHYRRHRH